MNLADLIAYRSTLRNELARVDTLVDAARQTTPRASRPPLTRPDGSNPERFYQVVAERYAELVAYTAAPAKTLAGEAGVPTPTVHRWIREARVRGLLAPAARRGKRMTPG